MWLIRKDVALAMKHALASGIAPTAEQQREFQERVEAQSPGDPRNMVRSGALAEIRVEGVLTKRPSFLAWLFGGGNTTYGDIQRALAVAQNDPSIREAVLYIDSPGGEVDGLFDTFAAIESFRSVKKLSVRAANATSAAYGIAAAAGKITALNPASTFGSIGVAVSYFVDDQIVELTNTDSPDKRPDLSTDEGRAVVVAYLDALYDLFVDAIARGRGTTKQDVVENFGRGAVMVASEAKRRGMIDALQAPPSGRGGARAETTADAGGQPRKKGMTKQELHAQYPELYAAILAEGRELGAKEALDKERDRVKAHLHMGEKTGAMDTAIKAIREGLSMTEELTAIYLTAGMNRAAVMTRQAETDAAGVAADGASAPEGQGDLGDQIVAILERQKQVIHG